LSTRAKEDVTFLIVSVICVQAPFLIQNVSHRFKEIRDYVLTRRDAMRPSSLLDVDDLLGEVAPKAKGFAQ
jgi:hypothetical protein